MFNSSHLKYLTTFNFPHLQRSLTKIVAQYFLALHLQQRILENNSKAPQWNNCHMQGIHMHPQLLRKLRQENHLSPSSGPAWLTLWQAQNSSDSLAPSEDQGMKSLMKDGSQVTSAAETGDLHV